MKKKKAAIVAAVVILAIVGVVWAWPRGPDPQVKKVQEMGKELFGADERPDRKQMEKFREEVGKLTPEQRRELHRPMRERMAQRMNKMIDGYFALPPDQRKKYLDKHIQESEKRRKERERRGRQRQAGGPPGQSAGGPGMGPNRTPPRAGQHRGRGSGMPDERAQRRNRRLDRLSPEQRAKWTEFRDAVRKRRIELGLPPHPWGRGPRGR